MSGVPTPQELKGRSTWPQRHVASTYSIASLFLSLLFVSIPPVQSFSPVGLCPYTGGDALPRHQCSLASRNARYLHQARLSVLKMKAQLDEDGPPAAMSALRAGMKWMTRSALPYATLLLSGMPWLAPPLVSPSVAANALPAAAVEAATGRALEK